MVNLVICFVYGVCVSELGDLGDLGDSPYFTRSVEPAMLLILGDIGILLGDIGPIIGGLCKI